MEWDKNRFRAVNEMRDRRKYIQSFNTEEEIRGEMCKLCGVTSFEEI